MNKSFIPVIAALALSAAAAGAFIISSAHAGAQPPQHNPTLVQPSAGELLAQASTDGKPPIAERRSADITTRMAAMCADHYARAVGGMAYLETRLALTPAQQPVFARWKDVMLSQAKDRQGACAAHKMPERTGPTSSIDRMAREEDILKHRLATLDVERPALVALYGTLTPEQKQAFDRRSEGYMRGARAMMGPMRMGRPRGPGGTQGPSGRPMPSGAPPA